MEQDKTEEKLCVNCKYFLQHYVNGNGHFEKTDCGHCVKRRFGLNRLEQLIKNKTACELWERETEKKDKRKRYVDYDIKRLINLLEDYVQLLKLED